MAPLRWLWSGRGWGEWQCLQVAPCQRNRSQKPAQSWLTPLGCSEGKAQTLDLLSLSDSRVCASDPFPAWVPHRGQPTTAPGHALQAHVLSFGPCCLLQPLSHGPAELQVAGVGCWGGTGGALQSSWGSPHSGGVPKLPLTPVWCLLQHTRPHDPASPPAPTHPDAAAGQAEVWGSFGFRAGGLWVVTVG